MVDRYLRHQGLRTCILLRMQITPIHVPWTTPITSTTCQREGTIVFPPCSADPLPSLSSTPAISVPAATQVSKLRNQNPSSQPSLSVTQRIRQHGARSRKGAQLPGGESECPNACSSLLASISLAALPPPGPAHQQT